MRWSLLLVLCSALISWGAPPVTVRLLGILENGALTVQHSQAVSTCIPYGVITLEGLAAEAALKEACRQRINDYFRQAPEDADFGSRQLKPQQFYRIERRETGCILYARGRRSYAELLLESGLALVREGFDDALWYARYQRAQEGARRHRRGIWSDPYWAECAGGK